MTTNFLLTDNMSFFTGINGFEITVSLDYYTRAVYDKNRLILRINDFVHFGTPYSFASCPVSLMSPTSTSKPPNYF